MERGPAVNFSQAHSDYLDPNSNEGPARRPRRRPVSKYPPGYVAAYLAQGDGPCLECGGVRLAVLEGPPMTQLRGWSHFLLCVGEKKPVPFAANTDRAALRAVAIGAEFFPAGTWEADPSAPAVGGRFGSGLSPAVKEWLRGGALKV